MKKINNNKNTPTYLSSMVSSLLLAILVFLLMHKYAFDYRKTDTEYAVIKNLNASINNSIKEFRSDKNDTSHIDFINNTLIPHISREVSDPLMTKNAIIVIVQNKNQRVVAHSSDITNTKWKETAITYPFSLFKGEKGEDYTCYYYIPDIQILIIKKLPKTIIISSILFLMLLVLSIYLFLRWIKGKKESKIRDDFFQNVTHELKTPIATTSIAIDIIKKFDYNLPPEKIKNYINIITEENRKMKAIVDRILSISVVDHGASKMNISEVDIHELLQNITKNLSFVVTEKGGIIEEHYEATQPILHGDASFISMIFTNLLDNAIKYSPESPSINIQTSSDRQGVTIHISDKGIGIPNDALTKIFSKSYRINNGYNIKGFGLGLYFVKQLVEMHNGKITVNSTVGKGSDFCIFLPYHIKNK